MLLRMKQANCACFSLTPNPWESMAKRRSMNLKFPKHSAFTVYDLSVRQAKISRIDYLISGAEYTSSLAKQSIFLKTILSQSSSFCYTSARSRSMPVYMSSQVYRQRCVSMTAKSSSRSRPTLVRLHNTSITFLVSSLSFLSSNTLKRISMRSESSTACKFLWFIKRFLRARVNVLRHQRAKKSGGGQFLAKKECMASITKGYCEKRNGASVFTEKRRRVLMAQTASSRKLDCKAMMRCLTSGITGYSLVLLMKLTVEFWSLFSQYLRSQAEREECMTSPSFLVWNLLLRALMVVYPQSPLTMGFRCLPATSSGRSEVSSFPKKKRCSQPSRYF